MLATRIVVAYLKDGNLVTTEPMSEDLARQTLENMHFELGIDDDPERLVRVGARGLVRAGNIDRIELEDQLFLDHRHD